MYIHIFTHVNIRIRSFWESSKVTDVWIKRTNHTREPIGHSAGTCKPDHDGTVYTRNSNGTCLWVSMRYEVSHWGFDQKQNSSQASC